MSAPGPKWAAVSGSPVPSEPQDGCAPSSVATSPTHVKDEIGEQALLLLREFFLLLDLWDRQQPR